MTKGTNRTDKKVGILVKPRTPKTNKNRTLLPIPGENPRTLEQGYLDVKIYKQIEIDGVGMGVLTDGTPFLTGRGLARLCGIDSSRISEITADWDSSIRPATIGIRKILLEKSL